MRKLPAILIVGVVFFASSCKEEAKNETASAEKPLATEKRREQTLEIAPIEEAKPAEAIKAATPEEAFATIKAAMFKKDYDTVYACYSKKTQESLNQATALFKTMSDESLKDVADELLTAPEELRKATPADYLGILFSLADKIQSDAAKKKEFERRGKKVMNWRVMEIKEVKISGGEAEITTKPSGDVMHLTKENNFWKFYIKAPDSGEQ
ncbi:MAG: hypothetical protein Kow0090_20900 [Myxococcota bacterium]